MRAGGFPLLSFQRAGTHGGYAKLRAQKAFAMILAHCGLQLSLGNTMAPGESRLLRPLASSCLASCSTRETGLVSYFSPMLPVSDQEIKHGVKLLHETGRNKEREKRLKKK